MDIRPASYADILKELNLLEAYARECAIPEIGKTNPQADTYAALEAAGAAQCFSVHEEGKIVGFASILTSVLPHYGKKVGVVESLFVHPDFRRYSLDLLKIIEGYASAMGCGAILYSAPANSRFERFLNMRKDYRQTNTVFTKAL